MSQTIQLRIPDIGDFKNVPIIEILAKEGDTIAEGDTIVVLESDKATLDVPSNFAGTIASLAVRVGETVSEGALIGELTMAQRGAPAVVGKIEARSAGPPAERKPSEAVAPAPNQALTAPKADATPKAEKGLPAVMTASDSPAVPPHASPSVRKIARELGVGIDKVAGTGSKGRIVKNDIQSFVRQALTAPPPAAATGSIGLGLPAWPVVDYAKFGPVERRPLSRIVRISGPALARNAIFIPHVTNFDEADVTELEEFRKAANAGGDVKLSILPFVVKAAAAALVRYPAFNSSLDGDEMVLKRYYNIGVAADTPEGLVVPVIKAADTKGLREIAAEMADLAAAARNGKLKPGDMQGATFTISSLGGVGGTNFTPIINAPEVAILGLTRASIKPVWCDEGVRPRLIQPLSLSWDHRAVDGVAAARFLGFMKDVLGDLRRLIL
jgi:pyruvate dehydrogenase E2 component (dihydrolipoamide acetyltransferase)